MRHAPSTMHLSHLSQSFRPAPVGAIEWEELPSLAGRIRSLDRTSANSTAWDATRPAELETPKAPSPFREPLHGIAIREVTEPDVFRHFFGC